MEPTSSPRRTVTRSFVSRSKCAVARTLGAPDRTRTPADGAMRRRRCGATARESAMPSNEERACARRCARAQSLDLRALVAASRYDFLVHSCANAACGACTGALESRHRLPDRSLARAAQTRRIRRSSRAHCERPCEMQAQPSKPHCRSQVCARCRKKKSLARPCWQRHCPHARGITKGRCGRVAAGGRALRALVPARCGVRTQAARRSAVVAAEEELRGVCDWDEWGEPIYGAAAIGTGSARAGGRVGAALPERIECDTSAASAGARLYCAVLCRTRQAAVAAVR